MTTTLNAKYDLVASITVRTDKHGVWHVAHDVLDGREIDEDYSREHLEARLSHNGWHVLNPRSA